MSLDYNKLAALKKVIPTEDLPEWAKEIMERQNQLVDCIKEMFEFLKDPDNSVRLQPDLFPGNQPPEPLTAEGEDGEDGDDKGAPRL